MNSEDHKTKKRRRRRPRKRKQPPEEMPVELLEAEKPQKVFDLAARLTLVMNVGAFLIYCLGFYNALAFLWRAVS